MNGKDTFFGRDRDALSQESARRDLLSLKSHQINANRREAGEKGGEEGRERGTRKEEREEWEGKGEGEDEDEGEDERIRTLADLDTEMDVRRNAHEGDCL